MKTVAAQFLIRGSAPPDTIAILLRRSLRHLRFSGSLLWMTRFPLVTSVGSDTMPVWGDGDRSHRAADDCA